MPNEERGTRSVLTIVEAFGSPQGRPGRWFDYFGGRNDGQFGRLVQLAALATDWDGECFLAAA